MTFVEHREDVYGATRSGTLLRPTDLLALKCVIYAEGSFGLFSSKVAASFLRYKSATCVAVIDSQQSGKTVEEVLGYGGPIPVVQNLTAAMAFRPDVLIIGKAIQFLESGDFASGLPSGWKETVRSAIRVGLHVINTTHYRIDADRDLLAEVRGSGVTVWEAKQAPRVSLNQARALTLDSFIIHTCGSDCNIGKKTTALQIYFEANARGIKTGFAATGQTGTMISGTGITIDAVPGDFMAGAVEQVVLSAARGNKWVVVEGQASLNHIAHSGVALAILHGALPHALVFCHRMGLDAVKVFRTKIPPMIELIRLNEAMTRFERPAKVVAISLNSSGFTDESFQREATRLENECGLPVVDPCRQGAHRLVDVLADHCERLEQPH